MLIQYFKLTLLTSANNEVTFQSLCESETCRLHEYVTIQLQKQVQIIVSQGEI